MTTIRRELRLKFIDIVHDDALADLLADAALEVSGIKKVELPPDWLIAGGVSAEEIARINAKEQSEKRILDHFERAMGYNPLDWYSNKDLSALRKFLMTKTTEEIDSFAAWSKQKYSTLTPAKVRQYPRMAIDLWPQVTPVEADPRIREWKGDGFVDDKRRSEHHQQS